MRLIAVTSLVAMVASAPPTSQSTDPQAVAARVQARYAAIKDFEGDFIQTYEGGVLRTKTTESGTLAVKQPGLFRFVYTKPERKEFVSDGEKIYTYLVADKQVIVSPAPGPGESTTPALFLAGRADIARDFTATAMPLPSAPPGLVTLKLEPKKSDPDYQWFAIGVDRAGDGRGQQQRTDGNVSGDDMRLQGATVLDGCRPGRQPIGGPSGRAVFDEPRAGAQR